MKWTNIKNEMPEPYNWVIVGTNFEGDSQARYKLACWTIARFSDANGWEFFNEDENGCSSGPYAYDTDRVMCKTHITHWIALNKIP